MKKSGFCIILAAAFIVLLYQCPWIWAETVGTAFTYQGRLVDTNKPADGLYDLRFRLYDSITDGNQVGTDVNMPQVNISDGYFTVSLDFGSVFDGNSVWLGIGVRPGELEDPNFYTLLNPRQLITPAPYALYALNGSGSGGSVPWTSLTGVPAGFADGVDNGLTFESDPQVGSLNLGQVPRWNGSQLSGGTIYDTSEYVGIGIRYPSNKLDVAGHINASDSYKLGGITVLYNSYIADIFVGEGAGAHNSSGMGNSAVGYNALYLNTSGSGNSAVGGGALYSNISGGNNSAVGSSALYYNTSGSVNSALGQMALYSNTTGTCNSAIGSQALYANDTGSYNSAIGVGSLRSNTTGWENSALGTGTLYNNTSGNYNSAIGKDALYFNTTGRWNSAMGKWALYRNTTGRNNSAMGGYALYSNTIGEENSALGFYALYGNTTGVYNSASGSFALYSNTTGNYNSAIGYGALYNNTTGSFNSAVGHYAGVSNSAGSHNVFIGYYAGYGETGSDKLYIANSDNDANVLVYGDFSTGRIGISLTNPTEALDVDGTARLRGITSGAGTTVVVDAAGKLWKQSSSQRYKTNIETLDSGLESVLNLRLVRFEYKESGQKDIGLIAEEVEKISPDLVIYDGLGRPEAVKYDKIALYLLEVIKNQQQEIETLKNSISKNKALEQKVKTMESLVTGLLQQLEEGKK